MSDSKSKVEGEPAGEGAPVGDGKQEGGSVTVSELQAQLEAANKALAARESAEAELLKKLESVVPGDQFKAAQEEHQRVVSELNQKVAHANVMREFGLPTEVSGLVVGADEEEMRVAAQALVDFRGEGKGGFSPRTSRPGGGARGTGGAGRSELPTDPAKLAAMIPRNGLVV